MWPGGARCGLTCRSAVAAIAGYGPVWLDGCGRWLPVRLPGISLATLTIRTIGTFLRPDRPDPGAAAGHCRGTRVLPGRNAASLLAGCGGALEDRRDFLDLVQLARGDLHDQFVCLVIGERQASAVQAVEGDHRSEREPLVAVDQGMVARQRV